MEPSNDDTAYLILTQKDLHTIKDFAKRFWDGTIPKGLTREGDLHCYLIVSGFLSFLSHKGINIPIEADFTKK